MFAKKNQPGFLEYAQKKYELLIHILVKKLYIVFMKKHNEDMKQAKISLLIFSLFSLCSFVFAPILFGQDRNINQADAVTHASQINFFTSSSMNVPQLFDYISNNDAVGVLSTVGDNGEPNSAIITPYVVGDRVIMFDILSNQTRQNLIENPLAFFVIWKEEPSADPASRYQGARLKLELIRDESDILRLRQDNELKSESLMFFRILKVLPLG